MENAVNISPIELAEEGLYNFGIMLSIAGSLGAALVLIHLAIFHSIFSYIFLGLALFFIIVGVLTKWRKSKRFGKRNLTQMERIVTNENDIATIKQKLGMNEVANE